MLIEKEMGLTRADFFRLLPRAVGNNPYETDGDSIVVQLATGSLTITLGPELERKMFLVTIPYMPVSFLYEGVEERDRLAFVQYFDLRFMRGLG